jgi:soluble lytic murein transglycosylase-like protein
MRISGEVDAASQTRRQGKTPMKLLLAVLMCGLTPAGLLGQAEKPAGDLLDAWRARLDARMDGDIAQLSSARDLTGSEVPEASGPESERVPERPQRFQGFASKEDSRWASTVAAILHKQGLPVSLISVAAVESSFNPLALSPKGARGLWQLMPATARRYGLVVSEVRDDRTDPMKSTSAAAQYLKALYAQFGSWPLALAAYNAGEARVQRSLEFFGARDFRTLRRDAALPKETLRYVPAVLERIGSSFNRLDPVLEGAGSSPQGQDPVMGNGAGHADQVVFALTSPEN